MSLQEMINVFGLFYCKIKPCNSYLGLLPVINYKGIIMPKKEESGTELVGI